MGFLDVFFWDSFKKGFGQTNHPCNSMTCILDSMMTHKQIRPGHGDGCIALLVVSPDKPLCSVLNADALLRTSDIALHVAGTVNVLLSYF